MSKLACFILFLMLLLLWVTNGFDLVFTLMAARLDGFQEANWIAAQLIDNPFLLGAFKVLMVLFASIIIIRFRKHYLTELGCWGLSIVYVLLSVIWWIHYFVHH